MRTEHRFVFWDTGEETELPADKEFKLGTTTFHIVRHGEPVVVFTHTVEEMP